VSGPSIRQPHAVQDMPSRTDKGLKIERLLGLAQRTTPMRLLEIGTGTGGIARYFGTHQEMTIQVDAVDVVDVRRTGEGFNFHLVEGTALPFEDNTFDVVVSNHVIEHVGAHDEQLQHLRELKRVMRTDGIGYMAVPNRWMLVEPHYRLVFLSWLPRSMRTPYLAMSGKGAFYDCEPLASSEIRAMFTNVGLRFEPASAAALQEFVRIEGASPVARALAAVPLPILERIEPMFPTLIYKLWKR